MFGGHFNQNLDRVNPPNALRSAMFGGHFDQGLDCAWLGGFLLSQPCFLVGARTASGLRGVGLCGPCVARWLSAFAAMLSGWRPDGLGPSRRRPVRPLRGSEAFCFRSRASWWTPGRPQAFAASACAVPAWLGGSQLSQPCFLVGARTASILRGVGLKDS